MTNLSRAIKLNNKGQAMVEMAFVIFLLVLLIFGMTEFGRAMYTKNTLNNAARAGARAAVVTSGIVNCAAAGLASPCAGDGPIFTTIDNSIVAAIDKSTVNVTVALLDNAGNGKSPPAITGDQIRVTVTAVFNPVLGLMRRMIRGTLSGEATMRFE